MEKCHSLNGVSIWEEMAVLTWPLERLWHRGACDEVSGLTRSMLCCSWSIVDVIQGIDKSFLTAFVPLGQQFLWGKMWALEELETEVKLGNLQVGYSQRQVLQKWIQVTGRLAGWVELRAQSCYSRALVGSPCSRSMCSCFPMRIPFINVCYYVKWKQSCKSCHSLCVSETQ